MSSDGQRIKWRRNIAENFNRLSRVHERYRQTDRRTDGPPIFSELTFTFAKNGGGASGHLGGGTHHGLWGIDAPAWLDLRGLFINFQCLVT